MTNNFSTLFPILIDPVLLPIFHVKMTNEEKKGLLRLDHSPRPYRVLVSKDNIMITELMLTNKGTVTRTPWRILKEDYLQTGNTKFFYLMGRNGRYFLLPNGEFKVPIDNNKGIIHVFINNIKIEFDDIFPYTKYFINARSLGKSHGENLFVGIGWRKVIPIQGRDFDVSISLLVDALERGIGWKVIISEPQNEKYLYPTSLNYLPEQGELRITIESEEK